MLYLNDNEVKFIILPNQEKRLDLPLEFINNLHENIVLWTYETDASIFELLLFDEVMAKLEHRYKLVIGYMPYSRMDRVHEANTAFSLKVIVQLLSEQTSALEEVFVLDPHSPETLNKFKEFGMKVQEIDYSLADEVMEFANVMKLGLFSQTREQQTDIITTNIQMLLFVKKLEILQQELSKV